VIVRLRRDFNARFTAAAYARLKDRLDERCGTHVGFRVAETPVFLPAEMLDAMARTGAELTERLLANPAYLAAAERSIPTGYRVAGNSAHPHFMTADFALVRSANGHLEPRLVELQAFPSVFGYQAVLAQEYRRAYSLGDELELFLSGLDEDAYWHLLRKTIVGDHDPRQVVLSEVTPLQQKTLPDFLVTAQRLGIALVDIAEIEPQGRRLRYRDAQGRWVQIRRIYNRAIADEMIARQVRLRFDLEAEWDVQWAGHPNWYFRISKFALPWLSGTAGDAASQPSIQSVSPPASHTAVPPAAFLQDFLAGPGYAALQRAGVRLPQQPATDAVYQDLLLKPLYSFAGKGIVFAPSHAELEAIPLSERGQYLVQQRMRFEPTIETPHGPTQAEIRILYAWPDGGAMTPAISLVRLGRGQMMGVDHNRDLEWVGASAAFRVPNG
jgi:hypothetical protein